MSLPLTLLRIEIRPPSFFLALRQNLEKSINPFQIQITLVTQPMLQLRPNWTELRSMDYYHQIFCRFFSSFGGVKGNF